MLRGSLSLRGGGGGGTVQVIDIDQCLLQSRLADQVPEADALHPSRTPASQARPGRE